MFRLLLAMIAVFLVACGRGGPDPRTLIPVDSDAWVAVRPSGELAARIGPVVETYPEFGGGVDFIRSVVGIDYARPESDSGLDPRRGMAVALWRDGLLVLLPVVEQKSAIRKIALRMARFGFVQKAGGGKILDFESERHGHACLAANSGVAAVFIGPSSICPLLAGVADEADDSRESVVRMTLETVSSELALEDADVIFRAANRTFAPRLLKMAGLPDRGPAAYMAQGMIGDLRGVVRFDRSVSLRLALGSESQPFKAEPPAPVAAGEADAVKIDVTIGPSIRPLLDSLVPLCGRRCSSRGIDMMVASWDGRMEIRVPSTVEGQGGRGHRGLLEILAGVTDRVTVSAVAGMRRPGRGILDFVRKRLQQVEDPVSPGAPVLFKFEGHDIAVAAGADRLAVAAGPRAARAVSGFTAESGSDGLPDWPETSRLAAVRVNPEGLLNITGFGFLEYLRRLVNPLREAWADVYYEQGRVILDGRVIIR